MESTNQEAPLSPKKRIVFIDALRGYAILMMLQGHTGGLLLDDAFRDDKYPLYVAWHYMTGLTAPTFFFASGLIFTFLLLKQEDPAARLRKGFRRGCYLILLGFALQLDLVDIFQALTGQNPDYNYLSFLNRSHVLHAIGLAIISIVGIFRLSMLTRIPFLAWTLVLATLSFVLCPLTMTLTVDGNVPRVLVNFFGKPPAGFPLLPWLGFSLFGCVAGIVTIKTHWYENTKALVMLLIGGFILSRMAFLIFDALYSPFMKDPGAWTKLSGFSFYRLGEVLMLTAIIAGLVHLARLPRFLIRAGSETLTIFFLHVILLYGGLSGFGLRSFDFTHSLNPWLTVGCAVLVVAGFAWMALHLEKLRERIPPLRLLR